MLSSRLTLLTRIGCVGCTVAATQLQALSVELGVTWSQVDVDEAAKQGDRELRAEYGDRLPVVLLDGREHSWGSVDEPRLRTDLAHP